MSSLRLSAPALENQADGTILILLLLSYLKAALGGFAHHSLERIALSDLAQEAIDSQRLVPELQVSNQLVLTAIPAKTNVIAVVLFNGDVGLAGLSTVSPNWLWPWLPINSKISQSGLQGREVTNLSFDLAKV